MDWFSSEGLLPIVHLIISVMGAIGVLHLTLKSARSIRRQPMPSRLIAFLLLFVLNIVALQFLISSLTEFLPESFTDLAVATSLAARIVLTVTVLVIIINFEESDHEETP